MQIRKHAKSASMRTSEAALADDAARHLRASCDQISAMLQRQRMADEEAAIAAVKRRFGTPVVDEPAGSSCVEALDSAIEAGVEQGLLARELFDAECRIERLAAQLAHTQHQLAAALAREDGLRRSLEEVLGQHLTGSRPCANGLLMAWANTHLPAPHMCGKPPADPPQPLSARSESEERGGGSPIPEGASTPTWLRRAAALIPECDLEWDLGVTPGAPPAQTAPAAASQTPLTADSASVAIACAATGAATRTVDATANSPYTAGGAPSGWSSPLEQQPQVAAPIELNFFYQHYLELSGYPTARHAIKRFRVGYHPVQLCGTPWGGSICNSTLSSDRYNFVCFNDGFNHGADGAQCELCYERGVRHLQHLLGHRFGTFGPPAGDHGRVSTTLSTTPMGLQASLLRMNRAVRGGAGARESHAEAGPVVRSTLIKHVDT